MGRVRITEQTTPSTPPSGTGEIFIDSADGIVKSIDDAGSVTNLGGGVPTSRTITAGVGLSGGGDLSANRTIDLDVNDITTLSGSTDTAADFVPIYDASGAVTRKVLIGNLGAALSATTITAGVGLSGGGDLSTNRTIDLDVNDITTLVGSTDPAADFIPIYDASGSVTRKVLINDLGFTAYTDEQAQDAVGTILGDSSTIDFTYSDATPSITAVVIPGGISHTAITNIGTNTHAQIDTHIASTSNPHSTTASQVGAPPTSRTITAGIGLSGGGDLSSDRTIDLDVSDITTLSGLTDPTADFVPIYDTSGAVTRKVLINDLGMSAASITRFGDGSDGSVTISSGTTTLTRDMYYLNLTLSGTGVLNTANYRVFVAGTLDISAAQAGAIICNGGNGGAGQANGTAGTQGAALAGNSVGGGGQGGAGAAGTTGAGAQGSIGTSHTGNGGTIGGSGAAGGSGNGGANAGGILRNGGTALNSIPMRRWAVDLIRSVTPLNGGPGGSGGGSGGGDGSVNGGGGGGGATGGGVIYISAFIINRGGSTPAACIQVRGGTGAVGGAPASGNAGGGGGGGGGAGGWIYLAYNSLTGSTGTNCLDASGGPGGNGGNAQGTGVGGNGGGSGAGGRITQINLGAGSSTDSTGSTTVAGGAASGTTGGTGAAINTQQVSL